MGQLSVGIGSSSRPLVPISCTRTSVWRGIHVGDSTRSFHDTFERERRRQSRVFACASDPSGIRSCIAKLEQFIGDEAPDTDSRGFSVAADASTPPAGPSDSSPSVAPSRTRAGAQHERAPRPSGCGAEQGEEPGWRRAMSRAIEAIMPEEQGDAKDWAWMWGSSFVLLWASCAFVQLYLHAMRMAGCL